MATAASRTTNPLLLAVIVGAVAVVVSARRTDAPWASGFGTYLVFGLVIIAIRVVFRMVFDAQDGTHVLFTLPSIPLPAAAAGIRIGGEVSAEGVLAAIYDGMRLATMIVCLGAANVLANPKRLLASVPSALYEVGSAVTVALSVAPQLIESGRRVTRARRLRGEVGRRTHWFRQVAVPVMTDALDRSVMLAAAMDSRGYGRTATATRASRRVTGVLVVGGLAGVCIGIYGLLDATTPRALGLPLLAVGLAAAASGFALSGTRVRRTRYRPDPWRLPEWGVTVVGLLVAVGLHLASARDPMLLNPPTQPLQWPALPAAATLVVLIGMLPAVLAPPPLRARTATPDDPAARTGLASTTSPTGSPATGPAVGDLRGTVTR